MENIINDMFAVGAHYGYSRTRRHPSTVQYIYGSKNRTDIIDLEKTSENLTAAVEALGALSAGGKQILFVGTKPEAKELVKTYAASVNMPYVENRWIGGTLTNDKQIKIRVNLLDDLSTKRDKNELVVMNKKERLLVDRKIAKLDRNFSGLANLAGLPAALVVIDTREEHIAVTEANKLGIPVIGLCNTDCDMGVIALPIPANDGSKKSIEFFLKQITAAIKS
jgi:small subunit ribosomal protein S2